MYVRHMALTTKKKTGRYEALQRQLLHVSVGDAFATYTDICHL